LSYHRHILRHEQFHRFCKEVIDRDDLAQDARFKTNLDRRTHRDILVPEILKELKARPRQLLLQKLTAAGIPCGEVLGLLEALQSERVKAGGLVTQQTHPSAGSTPVLSPPYRFDGERMPVRMPPPVLGEGTQDILHDWLGLSSDKINELKQRGVL
jgi:crotonobetainyl-CoA:carnitine CoA-transferase CaiB-like acyl-CoA transferase